MNLCLIHFEYIRNRNIKKTFPTKNTFEKSTYAVFSTTVSIKNLVDKWHYADLSENSQNNVSTVSEIVTIKLLIFINCLSFEVSASILVTLILSVRDKSPEI